ncbi:hypothetical protein C8R44DRAFT_798038 [Mycena epipterygia]|nr:hypothetical protein C8R44DRAFT_798038 [Mycena epipterygia]
MQAIRHLLDTGNAELQRLSETALAISLVLSEVNGQISERSVALAALKGIAIRRFPPEILGHIFILGRDENEDSHEHPTEIWSTADPTHAPMAFGQMCSYWRSVAHGTPQLWSRVCLPVTCAVSDRTAPFLRHIFERSRSLPLSLKLISPHMNTRSSFSDGNARLWAIVWDRHLRLEHIHISLHLQYTAHVFPRDIFFPILSSLKLTLS